MSMEEEDKKEKSIEKYVGNSPLDSERSAPKIEITQEELEEKIVIKAKFPYGPTPLYFGPPVDFDDFSTPSWQFQIELNSCWICGVVPLGQEDYLGQFSYGKSPAINLEKDPQFSIKTPSFSCREIELPELEEMSSKLIKVFVDNKTRSLHLQFDDAIQKTFVLTDSKWDKGFSFCVGGCLGAVLTMEMDCIGSAIKPAKIR